MILFSRHVLLVVWKCLILCKIIVICGKCWFSFSFKENGGWTASKAPKRLRRCCSKWNNVPWLVPSLQRRWFRCWRPSTWRKTKNLRRCWNADIAKQFPSNCMHCERFKNNTIRSEARKCDSTAWLICNHFFNFAVESESEACRRKRPYGEIEEPLPSTSRHYPENFSIRESTQKNTSWCTNRQ